MKSGQEKVIFFKSVIIFKKNKSQAYNRKLANTIGINTSNKKGKYLGLPMALGREKNAATGEIISSVATVLPAYQASSLLLPKKVCDKLDSLNCNFWWGFSDEKKM